ncbi:MAG: AraC family transcriptional regulator [Planctomycetes bacterium]|nr:AraC family transcriptional regulator [Planctomycetota bacterium]
MAFTLYERKTRPAIHKCIDLPIIVKTAGHYILPQKNYDSGKINADTNRIFWFLKGQGVMRCGSRVIPLQAGQVAYYEPFSRFYIEARNGPLEYYWTSMLGKLMTPIAQSLGIESSGLYDCSEIPSDLINKIHWHLDDTSPAMLRQSSRRSYHLLSLINSSTENTTNNEVCNKALTLIHHNWQDANFSINSSAQILKIHRSSLNRLFQEHIGSSPGQYLIRYRLQEAVQRLKESSAAVADIAHDVGYADAHYFSRHFKKEIGCTPSEFRQQNISVPWE